MESEQFGSENKDTDFIGWDSVCGSTDENPLIADAFWEKLPIEGKANLWGDEIYFSTSISIETENPRSIVNLGDVAY